jgi:hypothetical protein
MLLRRDDGNSQADMRCFGFLHSPPPFEILRFPEENRVGDSEFDVTLRVTCQGVWILERKLCDSRAEAKPVYRILSKRPELKYVEVTLERDPKHPDRLSIIKGQADASLQLTTMLDEFGHGYWIDTGRFARTADLGYGD